MRNGFVLVALLLTASCESAAEEAQKVRTDRLLVRENVAWKALQEGRFDELVAMESGLDKDDGTYRQNQVAFYEKAAKSVRILDWCCLEIRTFGDSAQVRTRVRSLSPSSDGGWQEWTSESVGHWIWEDGDWFTSHGPPKEWNEAAAKKVAIPAVLPENSVERCASK